MEKVLFIAAVCTIGVIGIALCVYTIVKAMDGKQRLDMVRIEAAHTLAELRDQRSGRG